MHFHFKLTALGSLKMVTERIFQNLCVITKEQAKTLSLIISSTRKQIIVQNHLRMYRKYQFKIISLKKIFITWPNPLHIKFIAIISYTQKGDSGKIHRLKNLIWYIPFSFLLLLYPALSMYSLAMFCSPKHKAEERIYIT